MGRALEKAAGRAEGQDAQGTGLFGAALRDLVVISNPAAGRGGRRKLRDALAVLEHRGIQVEHRETGRRGDAERLAREAAGRNPRPGAVVAAGGDGTIHEVVNGLAYTGVPLGVLPLGTANVYARELGLPPEAADAARALLGGTARRVHLGMAGDRYFLAMAGVGFDAQVVYELDLGLKRLLGRLAYVSTGLRVLAAPPRHCFDVELEGETICACGAVIGKGRYWGGAFQVTPDARVEEPELYLCLFTRSRPWDLMRYAAGILSGRHLAYPDVVLRRARRFSVRCSRPLHVQADGDLAGTLPMEFSVAEGALSVLAPPAAVFP